VLVQRRSGGRWRTVDSDLGLDVLWSVDSQGVYRAEWEPPFDAPLGVYRFGVEANGYALRSSPFALLPTRALTARRVDADPGKVAVVLDYPAAQQHETVGDPAPDATADLTARPASASAGTVRFLVNGKPVTASAGPDGHFQVPAPPGASIEVAPGAGRDAYGNRNSYDLSFTA